MRYDSSLFKSYKGMTLLEKVIYQKSAHTLEINKNLLNEVDIERFGFILIHVTGFEFSKHLTTN